VFWCKNFQFLLNENIYLKDLSMGQCKNCLTIQLTNPFPAEQLKPKYSWITCTEPEEHLDELVEKLISLPNIERNSRIIGVSFKEDSTLLRFNKFGFNNTWRIDEKSLGINDEVYSVETVQEKLDHNTVSRIKNKSGLADILIARHIIEHANNPKQFLESCKDLIRDDGYIVFEIPDCEYALEKRDYTTIWEEHTLYFTRHTFKQMFSLNQLELVSFKTIPYAQEMSHIVIAKKNKDIKDLDFDSALLKKEKELSEFFNDYSKIKIDIHGYLLKIKKDYGKIALFGAGHMGCMFLNIMGLDSYIDYVVDDNPRLKGMAMPGSDKEIISSSEMKKYNIKFCLLSVSEIGIKKVFQNNKEYLSTGGVFKSIFPGSEYAMDLNSQ